MEVAGTRVRNTYQLLLVPSSLTRAPTAGTTAPACRTETASTHVLTLWKQLLGTRMMGGVAGLGDRFRQVSLRTTSLGGQVQENESAVFGLSH